MAAATKATATSRRMTSAAPSQPRARIRLLQGAARPANWAHARRPIAPPMAAPPPLLRAVAFEGAPFAETVAPLLADLGAALEADPAAGVDPQVAASILKLFARAPPARGGAAADDGGGTDAAADGGGGTDAAAAAAWEAAALEALGRAQAALPARAAEWGLALDVIHGAADPPPAGGGARVVFRVEAAAAAAAARPPPGRRPRAAAPPRPPTPPRRLAALVEGAPDLEVAAEFEALLTAAAVRAVLAGSLGDPDAPGGPPDAPEASLARVRERAAALGAGGLARWFRAESAWRAAVGDPLDALWLAASHGDLPQVEWWLALRDPAGRPLYDRAEGLGAAARAARRAAARRPAPGERGRSESGRGGGGGAPPDAERLRLVAIVLDAAAGALERGRARRAAAARPPEPAACEPEPAACEPGLAACEPEPAAFEPEPACEPEPA